MPIHPNAQQCAYVKVDGARCGGPAVRDSGYCHHHDSLKTRLQDRNFRMPALDDQNAVQVALMDVINALLTRTIDRADAYAVLYALQLAKSNLKGLTLSPLTPSDLEEKLANARAEGRAEGLKEGRRQARAEMEREQDRQGQEDNESLAAFLMRELTAPPESNA